MKACSDSFVGVQHNSEGCTNCSWGQVLGELGTNEAVVSVVGDDSSPHGLVASTSLHVLGFEDISDALSVVPVGCLAVVGTLNL